MFIEDASVVEASIIDDGRGDHDKDDDFVSNPPPTIRAPAVIEVPSLEHVTKRRIGSRRRRKSTVETNDDNDLFGLPHETDVLEEDKEASLSDTQKEVLEFYRLSLFSSVTFLVASCVYLQVSVLRLLANERSEESDGETESYSTDSNNFLISILSIIAYAGFVAVGGIELLCTQWWIGGNMVVASSFGIAGAVILLMAESEQPDSLQDLFEQHQEQHRNQYIHAVLSAVSAHLFAVVAASSFILHESNKDDEEDSTALPNTTTLLNNSENNTTIKKQQYLHKNTSEKRKEFDSSMIWKRLADNTFVAGTFTDAVLSYFYVAEAKQNMDAPATVNTPSMSLIYASVGAACFWIIASILFLVVTIQSHSDKDGSNSSCGWICCCCGNNKSDDGSSMVNIDTVAITVVEGDNAMTEIKQVMQDRGVLSYCAQMPTPDLDYVCGSFGIKQPKTQTTNTDTTSTDDKNNTSTSNDVAHWDSNIFCNSY